MTSLPRSVRTSSIHRAVFRKDCRSAPRTARRHQACMRHAVLHAPAHHATLACMTAAAPLLNLALT